MRLQQLGQLLLNGYRPLRRRHHFGNTILCLIAAAMQHYDFPPLGVLLMSFDPQHSPLAVVFGGGGERPNDSDYDRHGPPHY